MSLDPRIRVCEPRAFLTREHFQQLFGPESYLEFERPLGTQGGFMARQRLSVASPLGRVDGVPLHGPLGTFSGVEFPRSWCPRLQLDPPVRGQGDFEASPSITLIGPAGHLHLASGLIVAQRTLQLTPENARRLGLLNGDSVVCLVRSTRRPDLREATRDTIFSDVDVVVGDGFELELHLDLDDACACLAADGGRASILNIGQVRRQRPDLWLPVGRLVSEADVRRAAEQGLRIRVTPGMILTPAARDLGQGLDIFDRDPA